MSAPLFHVVCHPSALDGEPAAWAAEMLRDGDVALLPDTTGLEGLDRIAHALGSETVTLVRSEPSRDQQDRTVMAYAGTLPLIWLAPTFSGPARTWARERAPMTLLVEVEGALPAAERARVERFIAILGRQSE